jgi:hypothetical protein
MDAKEKAFEYAGDSSKLLITLATGIIAFTVTFAKEFGVKPSSMAQGLLLLVTWVVLLVSAAFGVSTLLAITGELEPKVKSDTHEPSIRDHKITSLLACQIVVFLFGVVLIVIYGGLKINAAPTPTPCTSPTPTPTAEPSAVPASTSPTPISLNTPKATATTPISTPTPRLRPKPPPAMIPTPSPSPCKGRRDHPSVRRIRTKDVYWENERYA